MQVLITVLGRGRAQSSNCIMLDHFSCLVNCMKALCHILEMLRELGGTEVRQPCRAGQ